MTGLVRSVSEEELVAAYSGPAPGANKFIITVGQPGVRIAFMEVNPDLPGKAFFQSAVTLHPADAITLHKILAEMLKDIERQFSEADAKAAQRAENG